MIFNIPDNLWCIETFLGSLLNQELVGKAMKRVIPFGRYVLILDAKKKALGIEIKIIFIQGGSPWGVNSKKNVVMTGMKTPIIAAKYFPR